MDENYDESIIWIDFSKVAETVGSVEDEQLWNQKGSFEPWDAIVDGNRSASEGLKSRANGSGDFYVTGGAACFLTAQSHHRYS